VLLFAVGQSYLNDPREHHENLRTFSAELKDRGVHLVGLKAGVVEELFKRLFWNIIKIGYSVATNLYKEVEVHVKRIVKDAINQVPIHFWECVAHLLELMLDQDAHGAV